MRITTEIVLEIIKKEFQNEKFTTGDIYYNLENTFNLAKFGSVRNILVNLTKKGILDFKIEIRGSPHFYSDRKRKGAIYNLK